MGESLRSNEMKPRPSPRSNGSHLGSLMADVGTRMSSLGAERRHGPLDSVVRLVTPERIVIAHPLAGPSRRFVAYLIDQIIIIVVLLALLLALSVTIGLNSALGPFLLVYFALNWGYGAFCEGVFNGQTVGKHAMGIRVISERGVPITGAQAVVRNLVGSVDGLVPLFYQTALASMFLSRKFQRLGDLAAGTMVVIEERRWRRGVTRIDDPEVAAILLWLPGRIAAGSDLARVLSDYVEVRRRFGPLRRAEMAEPLARPLRKRFGLAERYSADSVLCAVYHQVFVGE
jgi:uncharacterized RDD family membrane protein YckC